MSVITKPCDTCEGAGWYQAHWGRCDCVDCGATGRVPDVEATLRAELDAARADRDSWRASYRAEKGAADELRAKLSDCTERLIVAFRRIDDADAEIARLTAEVDRMTAHYRYADDGHDENMRETARLIGEVERLTAREREAASVMRAHLNGDATNRMCAAWLAGRKP